MAYGGIIFACLAALVFLTMIPFNSFAQQSGWVVTTSGAGSLDIMLEQIWTDNGTARFRVSFLNPGTTQVHQHQDYDILIRQGENQIFSAAAAANQALIHNAEGTVTVPLQPFNFAQNGDYVIEVQLLGLGLPSIPIKPEIATFPITVTPEFPATMIGILTTVIASSIAITRKLKKCLNILSRK